MPIYEYHCKDCGKDHEIIRKFSDKPLKLCPSCGGSKMKKKLSLSGFQLKGSGWYKDGYSSAKSESKPETKTETKAETKSDAKVETKPATPATKESPKASKSEKT